MVTTVTLNASIDKAYRIRGNIAQGTVTRVLSCRNTAGGKGLNVARALLLCGESAAATGFAGGYNGAYLEALLREDGIENRFIHIEGETRCCINILNEEYESTEFLEPGTCVREEELDEFISKFDDNTADSSVVILSGSVPVGVEKDIYRRLVRIARSQGKAVILDTSGELLEEGLKAGPHMVKPNRKELEMLVGETLPALADVKRAAVKIHLQGIDTVVVSLGENGALMVCGDGVYLGIPPRIKAVNTVGCGDSMVAAFGASLSNGCGPEEGLRYAVAVSAANAMNERTGSFEPAVMKKIYEEVKVGRI